VNDGASLTAPTVIVNITDPLVFVPPPLSASDTVTVDVPNAFAAGV
jgi:hypothetical protein